MNAKPRRQMVVPKGVTCRIRGALKRVKAGCFVTIPSEGNKLFFVRTQQGCQVFLPVLINGTIDSRAKLQLGENFNFDEEVDVYIANQLPRLQIVDGDIVWAKITPQKKPK